LRVRVRRSDHSIVWCSVNRGEYSVRQLRLRRAAGRRGGKLSRERPRVPPTGSRYGLKTVYDCLLAPKDNE
jgi:hypothetical protein